MRAGRWPVVGFRHDRVVDHDDQPDAGDPLGRGDPELAGAEGRSAATSSRARTCAGRCPSPTGAGLGLGVCRLDTFDLEDLAAQARLLAEQGPRPPKFSRPEIVISTVCPRVTAIGSTRSVIGYEVCAVRGGCDGPHRRQERRSTQYAQMAVQDSTPISSIGNETGAHRLAAHGLRHRVAEHGRPSRGHCGECRPRRPASRPSGSSSAEPATWPLGLIASQSTVAGSAVPARCRRPRWAAGRVSRGDGPARRPRAGPGRPSRRPRRGGRRRRSRRRIASRWRPASWRIGSPVLPSQSRTERSPPAEINRRPSPLKASCWTGPECPPRRVAGLSSSNVHQRICGSLPAETNRVPSGCTATASTSSSCRCRCALP